MKKLIKHHVYKASLIRRWADENKSHKLAPEFNKRAERLENQIKQAIEEKLTCFDEKKYKVEKVIEKFDRSKIYE